MSKLTKILIIVGIIAVVILWGVRIYNNMVKLDEAATSAWQKVEAEYQRRADLIPNVVNTVKGAADYERGTLEAVIEARSNATSMKIDPSKLTEENIAAFQQVQDQLSSALSRLMVVVERYPELKANANFEHLITELEGTENRIKTARNNFNEAVQTYNTTIRRFPNNMFAGMFGFEKRVYFQAKEGAENAPEVNFEN